jgi:uncharacterized protein with beta-barrel porin domain
LNGCVGPTISAKTSIALRCSHRRRSSARLGNPTLTTEFQTLPGSTFIVSGATPAKNSALTSAGVELRLANGVTALAKFDGEFASHSSTYAGTGTVRYTW